MQSSAQPQNQIFKEVQFSSIHEKLVSTNINESTHINFIIALKHC